MAEHSEPGILQDTKNILNDNSDEKQFWQMQESMSFLLFTYTIPFDRKILINFNINSEWISFKMR